MYCKNCGNKINQGEIFCGSCGTKIEEHVLQSNYTTANIINQNNNNQTLNNNEFLNGVESQNNNTVSIERQTPIVGNNPYVQTNQNFNSNVGQTQTYNNPNNAPVYPKEQKDTKSLITLIIGIVSLGLCFFINVLILPLAIGGLILGLTNKNKDAKKTIGIILNACSIAIVIITLIISILAVKTVLNNSASSNENKTDINTILDSMSNWNRYESLRSGNIGKVLNINGGWRILDDSEEYWEFKNGEFWWYKSVDDLNDNYWYGTTNILTGKEGFKVAGLEESKVDNIISRSGGVITQNDIYTIVLTPTKIISGGIDKSSTNIPDGTKWTYVWILVNHDKEGIEAQVFNSSNSDTSYYVKLND